MMARPPLMRLPAMRGPSPYKGTGAHPPGKAPCVYRDVTDVTDVAAYQTTGHLTGLTASEDNKCERILLGASLIPSHRGQRAI